MRIFTRLSIAGVVALSAAVIPVTMAQAETSAPSSQQFTPDSSGDVALTWPAGTFVPNSDVTVVYRGSQGAPIVTTATGTAASLKSAAAGVTLIDAGDAASDGSLAVGLQFTADATGAYKLTFGDESGHSVVADVQTVQPSARTGGTVADNGATSTVGMGYLSLLVIWAAIGLAALVAGYVVVRITVRKQNALRVAGVESGAGAGIVSSGIPQPVGASN